jgi:hypothetical protein
MQSANKISPAIATAMVIYIPSWLVSSDISAALSLDNWNNPDLYPTTAIVLLRK